MEPRRRLETLWSWLPAFRAVAETQHLPTAARQLRLSASALSRSVRLLEEAIGAPLFRRQGRSLQLNEAGAALLGTVRTAMRLIDDALDVTRDQALAGPMRVRAPSDLLPLVVGPALVELLSRHPAVVPEVERGPLETVVPDLLSGRLDIAVYDQPVADPSIAATPLGRVAMGLYCHRTHPARKAQRLPASARHAFCAYDGRASLPPGATVGLVLPTLEDAVSAVLRIDLLLVGPAALLDGRTGLCRLRVLPARTLYAIHRQPVGIHRRSEALLEALGAVARRLGRRHGR